MKKRFLTLLSVVLFGVFSALSLPFFNKKVDASATMSTDTSSFVTVGELWDSSSKTVNEASVFDLAKYLTGNSIPTYGEILSLAEDVMDASEIRAVVIDSKTSSKDVVVTLGGLKWTVTYLSVDKDGNPILTLWLNNTYQELWNGAIQHRYGIRTGANTDTTVKYPGSMYGTSEVRAISLNAGGYYLSGADVLSTATKSGSNQFAAFTMPVNGDLNDITDFIVKPSRVGWQEFESAKELGVNNNNFSGDAWSTSMPDTGFVSGYNYASKQYSDVWKDDYLWLVSLSEVMGNNSLWRCSSAQKQSNGAYWTRSSYDTGWVNCVYPMLANGSNKDSSPWPDATTCCVRPALHLNLTKLLSAAGGNAEGIYLDPVNGSDSNSGTSYLMALKSLDVALAKASANTSVYLINTVTIEKDTTIDSNGAILKRWYRTASSSFKGEFFKIGSYTNSTSFVRPTVTFKNITLDGEGRYLTTSPIEIYSGDVYIEKDFVLQKCYVNGGSYCDGFRLRNNSNLTVNGGLFQTNAILGALGGVFYSSASTGYGIIKINGGEFYSNNNNLGGSVIYASGAEVIIDGGTFGAEGKSNTASNYGAVFYGGKITVNGGTFQYNRLPGGGGANTGGVFYGNNVIINGGTFSNNSSVDARVDKISAALIYSSNRLEINGGIFSNNTTKRVGAVAYCAGSGDVLIKDATFIGNEANGGGIFHLLGNRNVVVSNCVFDGNESSDGLGGVFYLAGASSMNITNTSFSNSSAKAGGVIFGLNGATLKIENCTFDSNKSTGNAAVSGTTYYGGGAIRLFSPAEVSISDCSFIKNSTPATSSDNGGAFYLSGAIPSNKVNISNTTFEENTSYNGGAVNSLNARYVDCDFISNKSSFMGGAAVDGYFSNCNFLKNSSTHGGALRLGSAVDCTFVENTASSRGGATNFSNCSNCTFESNTAHEGGACFSTTSSNCKFIKNKASAGGAFCADSSAYTARKCYFEENEATNGVGGAVYFMTGSGTNATCYVYTSEFVSNKSSSRGGAVYASTLVGVQNCNFVNNIATSSGGAVYSTATATVNTCLFENNTAISENGGAISVADISAKDCQFLLNIATKSGGAIHGTGTVSIDGCDFYDNLAKENGGAIYAGAGLVAGSSNFERNFARGEVSSTGYGGAIYIVEGNFEVFDTVIKNNLAKVKGAGVYLTGEDDVLIGRLGVRKYLFIFGNYIKSTWEGVSFDANGDILAGSADVMNDLYVDDIINGLTLVTDFEKVSKLGVALGSTIVDDVRIAMANGNDALISNHTLEMFALEMGDNLDVYTTTVLSGSSKVGVGVFVTKTSGTGIIYVASDFYGDFDGKEHTISVEVISPENYKVLYSETQNGTYTEAPISIREAGESKDVWFKIEANGATTTAEKRVVTLNKMDLSFDVADIDINFWFGISLVSNVTDITNFVDAVIYDLEGNAVSCKFIWTGSAISSVAANSFGTGVTKTINIIPYNSGRYRSYEGVTVTSIGIGYDNLYFNSSAFYPTMDFSKYPIPSSITFATVVGYVKENGTIYFNGAYNISGTQTISVSKNLNIARYTTLNDAYLGTIINIPSGAALNIVAESAKLIFDGKNAPSLNEENLNCNALIVNNGSLNLSGDITFQNCVNRNITATGSGAAIRSASNLTLDGVTVKDCVSMSFGAVYATAGTISIKNCIITSNTGLYGAGLYLNGAVDIENTQILANFASGPEFKGIGLVLYGASTVATLQNVKIYKNHFVSDAYAEGGNGGGLYIEGARVEIVNCEITYNTAFNGAAIYLANGANLLLDGNIINNNEAKNSGGVAFVETGATLEVVSGEFMFNSAAKNGYLVQSNGSTIFNENDNGTTIVKYNSNAGVETSYGLISVGGGTTTVSGGLFKENTGSTYTSFYVEAGFLKLYGGEFLNNTGAQSVYVAGTIGMFGGAGFDFNTIVLDELFSKEDSKIYVLGNVSKLPILSVNVSFVNWYAIAMPYLQEYVPTNEAEWVSVCEKFSLVNPDGALKEYIYDEYYYYDSTTKEYNPLYTIYYFKKDTTTTTPRTYYFDPSKTQNTSNTEDGSTARPFFNWNTVLEKTNDGDILIQVSEWKVGASASASVEINGGGRTLRRYFVSTATGANLPGNMISITDTNRGIALTINNLIIDGNKLKNGTVTEGDYTNYFAANSMIYITTTSTLNLIGGTKLINNFIASNNAGRSYSSGSNSRLGGAIFVKFSNSGLTFNLNMEDSYINNNAIYQDSSTHSETAGAGICIDSVGSYNSIVVNIKMKNCDLSHNRIIYDSTNVNGWTSEVRGGVALFVRESNNIAYSQINNVELIGTTFIDNTISFRGQAGCSGVAVSFYRYVAAYTNPVAADNYYLIDSCKFADNKCTYASTYGYNTGALAIFNTFAGVKVDIKNSSFENNQASNTNSVYIRCAKRYCEINIENCEFNSNWATSYEVQIVISDENTILSEVPVTIKGIKSSHSICTSALFYFHRVKNLTVSDCDIKTQGASESIFRFWYIYGDATFDNCNLVSATNTSNNYAIHISEENMIAGFDSSHKLNVTNCNVESDYGIYMVVRHNVLDRKQTFEAKFYNCYVLSEFYGIVLSSTVDKLNVEVVDCETLSVPTQGWYQDYALKGCGLQVSESITSTADNEIDIKVQNYKSKGFMRGVWLGDLNAQSAKVKIDNCNIEVHRRTMAEAAGIAVVDYCVDMDLSVTNCYTISNIRDTQFGIQMWTNNSRVSTLKAEIMDCSFKTFAYGVVLRTSLYFPNSSIKVSNCEFYDNSTSVGVYTDGTLTTITSKIDLDVKDCTFTDASNGVWIRVRGFDCEAKVTDCQFYTNTAISFHNDVNTVCGEMTLYVNNIYHHTSSDNTSIYLYSSYKKLIDFTIINAKLEGFTPTGGYGIQFSSVTNAELRNVEILNFSNGIRVEAYASGTNVDLGNTLIERCQYGIVVIGNIDGCTIDGGEISGCRYGIIIERTSMNNKTVIKNLYTHNNTEHGIYLYDENYNYTTYRVIADIINCRSINNTSCGIRGYQDLFYGSQINIINCDCEYNEYGINFYNRDWTIAATSTKYVSTYTIENTIASNNLRCGLYFGINIRSGSDNLTSNVIVKGSKFNNNCESGVYLYVQNNASVSRLNFSADTDTEIMGNREGLNLYNINAADRVKISDIVIKNNRVGITAFDTMRLYLTNATVVDNDYDMQCYYVYLSGNLNIGSIVYMLANATNPSIHIASAVEITGTIKLIPSDNTAVASGDTVVVADYSPTTAAWATIAGKFTCEYYTLNVSGTKIVLDTIKNHIDSSAFYFDPKNKTGLAKDSNNGRSISAPFLTWDTMISKTSPGATIYILSRLDLANGKSYDWGNRILKVYINPSTNAPYFTESFFFKNDTSALTIKNLIIDGNRDNEGVRQKWRFSDLYYRYYAQNYYRTGRILEAQISSSSNKVLLDNIQIKNVSSYTDGLFLLNNVNLEVNNLVFEDNMNYYDYAAFVLHGLYTAKFTDCVFDDYGAGIKADGGESATKSEIEITDCKFHDFIRYGVYINSAYVDLTVKGSEFKRNYYYSHGDEYVIYLRSFHEAIIEDCEFYDNFYAIRVINDSTTVKSTFTILGGKIVRNISYAMYLTGYLDITIQDLTTEENLGNCIIYKLTGGSLTVDNYTSKNNITGFGLPDNSDYLITNSVSPSTTFVVNIKNSTFINTQYPIMLCSESDNIVYNIINCTITNDYVRTDRGIGIYHTSRALYTPTLNIDNVKMSNCARYGIHLRDINANITNCEISDSLFGVVVYGFSNVTFSENTVITNCLYGVFTQAEYGDINVTFKGTILKENGRGIFFESTNLSYNIVNIEDILITGTRYMAIWQNDLSPFTELHISGGVIDSTNKTWVQNGQECAIYVRSKVYISGSPIIMVPIYSYYLKSDATVESPELTDAYITTDYKIYDGSNYKWDYVDGIYESTSPSNAWTSYYIDAINPILITLKHKIEASNNLNTVRFQLTRSNGNGTYGNNRDSTRYGNSRDYKEVSVYLTAGARFAIHYFNYGTGNMAYFKDLTVQRYYYNMPNILIDGKLEENAYITLANVPTLDWMTSKYIAVESKTLSDADWDETLTHFHVDKFTYTSTKLEDGRHVLLSESRDFDWEDPNTDYYEDCVYFDPSNTSGKANDGNTGYTSKYPLKSWDGVMKVANSKTKVYVMSTLTVTSDMTLDGKIGNDGKVKLLRYYWSDDEKFDGDLIKVNSGTLTLKNVIIDGNKTGNGSLESANYLKFASYLINVASGGSLVLDGCTIQNCYTDKDNGGAIFSSGILSISNSIFVANSANKLGGAIYVNGTSVSISNTTFNNNFAGISGGALAVERVSGVSEFVMTDSTFDGNRANTTSGGALYLSNVNVEITGTTFNSNIASDSGAAIYYDGNGAKFAVSGCEFNTNYTTNSDETASSVGGHTIYVRAVLAVVTIKNSNIDMSYGASNSASTIGLGGAIYVESNKNITISNGNISRSAANNGGAVYIKVTGADGIITISSLTIDNCTVKTKGIAIYLDSTSTIGKSIWSDIEVKNCYATGEFFHVESSSDVNVTNLKVYDTKNAKNINNDSVYVFKMSRNAILTTDGLVAENILTYTVLDLALNDASTAKLGGLKFEFNSISGYVINISSVSNNAVTILDSDISYNYAIKDSTVGEVLMVNKLQLVVQNTTIANNFAVTSKNEGSHGIVYILNSDVEFDGVTVKSNMSAGPAVNVEITDSASKNDRIAKFTGSYILDNVNVASSTNTNKDKLGGGIKLDNVGKVTFVESVVSGNTTTRLGAGILSINNDLKIVDSTISLNTNLSTNSQIIDNMFRTDIGFTATGYYVADYTTFTGGAGVATLGGMLTVSGAKILENISYGLGGGVLSYAPTVVEKDSAFNGNYAKVGGGLFITFDLQVYDSTFTGNNADIGAGIYYGGTLDIARTELSYNTAESYGSALYASSNNITLSAYRILVKENFVGVDGGIYFNRADGAFQISESEFIGNDSKGEGAAIFTNADVIISETSFSGNSFEGDSLIYLNGVVNSLFEFVTISGNYGYGINSSLLYLAGVSRDSGVMVLVNCSIYGNKMLNNASVVVDNNIHVAIQSTNIFGNINEGEGGKGGAIYVKEGSLLYQDADISDNWAENGSAIYVGKDSTVALFNVSITGNISNDNSNAFGRNGVIYIENGAEASFINSSIYKNELANANGIIYNDGIFNLSQTSIYSNIANNGIVYNSKNGLLSIENATISENSTKNAGALYNEGTVNFISGEIKNNTASASGGGVYNTGKFTLTGGTISRNTANNGGGVYNSGEFVLNGGHIIGNQIKISGGGIFNAEKGILVINSGNITENTIVSGSQNTYGFGIVNMGQAYMYDGKVSGNFLPDNANDGSYVNSRGGAIYCGDRSYLNIQGGELLDNIARNGATLYLDSHSVADISNITFDYVSRGFRSTSTRQGSAFYAYNATLSMKDCVIKDTLAQSSGGDGQRIYSSDSDITIKFTNFTSNNGAQGLFRFVGGSLYVEECSFTNNKAVNASGKGILQLEKLEQFTIRNCNFTGNNSSDDGGVMYIDLDASRHVVATIERCDFALNNSAGNGGAIFFTGDRITSTMYKSQVLVKDCVFTRNIARNGGAVYVAGGAAATIEFNNCTFGGWNDQNNNNTIEGSEVLGNIATENGGAIYYVRSDVSPRQVSVVLSGETTISYNIAVSTAGGIYYNYSNSNNTEENYFNLLLKDDSLITILNNYQGATVTNTTWTVGTGAYSNLYVLDSADLKIIRSKLKDGSKIGLTLALASGLTVKGTEDIIKGYSSSVPITTKAFEVFSYDQGTYNLKLNSATNSIVLTQKTAVGSDMYAEVSDKVYTMDGTKKGFTADDIRVFNGTSDITITFSNKQNGEFSEKSPTYTARGTYTIWYKIVDNTGSKTTVIGSANLKITGKILTVQDVPVARMNFGEQLKDAKFSFGKVTSDGSVVAGTWAFESGSTSPSNTNQTYKVVFTPDNADIYENVVSAYINAAISYDKVYYYSSEEVSAGFYVDSNFTKYTGINTLKNMVAAMQELGTIYFANTYTVGTAIGVVEENISFRYKIFFARYKDFTDGPIISLPQNSIRRILTLNGGAGELVIDGRIGTSSVNAAHALFDNYGELVIGSNVSIYNVCNIGGSAAVAYNHVGGSLYLNGATIYGAGSSGEESSLGGAIYNEGTLTINGGNYRENYATSTNTEEFAGLGGFVYNNGGTITINGGMFSSNLSDQGGVIYSVGGSVLLNGGDLILNHANQNGGAIYLTENAILTLNGSNLVFNTAGVNGGAIFSDEAVVYLNDANMLFNIVVGTTKFEAYTEKKAETNTLAVAVSVFLGIAVIGLFRFVLLDQTLRKRKLHFRFIKKR